VTVGSEFTRVQIGLRDLLGGSRSWQTQKYCTDRGGVGGEVDEE
jgi:hypothetical protein